MVNPGFDAEAALHWHGQVVARISYRTQALMHRNPSPRVTRPGMQKTAACETETLIKQVCDDINGSKTPNLY